MGCIWFRPNAQPNALEYTVVTFFSGMGQQAHTNHNVVFREIDHTQPKKPQRKNGTLHVHHKS